MKYNNIFLSFLMISTSALAAEPVDCVDCISKPAKENIQTINVLEDAYKIADIASGAPKSKWMKTALSKAQCTSILKNIDKAKLNTAIVPEIQSAIDVINAECGVGADPEVVAQDTFPFTIEGSKLFLSWDGDKLSVEEDASAKKEDLKVFTKLDLLNGTIVLTDEQKKMLDKQGMKEHVGKDLPSQGAVKKWWNATKSAVSEIMTEGETDLYIPMIAYHDRFTYTPEKLATLNEAALGLGVGKSLVNKKGNTEMLYTMVHLDSHGDVETNVGYGWMKKFEVSGKTKVGLGYAAGLVSRSDIAGRIPVPFAFPMASVEHGRASLNAIIIPKLNGGINHGNVLFIFGKYTWEKKKDKKK